MPRELLRIMYVDDLLHLWSAEKRLVVPLSRMARKATAPLLRQVLIDHSRQLDHHVRRLERIGEELGEPVRVRRCAGMDGLIARANAVLADDYRDHVMDAALVAVVHQIAHYKVTRYATARSHALALGYSDQVALLEDIWNEEASVLETLETMMEALIEPGAEMISGERPEPVG